MKTIKLSLDDRNFLFKKVEYTKKKKAIETENELFNLLNGSKDELSEEDVTKILKSLEYKFRTTSKSDVLKKLLDFVPSYIPQKFSNIDAKKKRDEKESNKNIKTFKGFTEG
jgi:hypothetical protein